ALALMTGQPVTVKTSDSVNHNVNFQLQNFTQNPVMPPGDSKEYTLSDKENGPKTVACNIHPWMQAYWLVVERPSFPVTGENGNYEIKNAPGGTQKVVVWQEATAYVSPASGDPVNITANDTTTHNIKIDPGKVK